ncbi:MAG: AAA family ATPase [Anaerolineaceae bacterium]
MPPLSDGGQKWLEGVCREKHYQLIVIDTFSRASNGLDDMQDISEMTKVMGGLQRMAMDNDIAILLVDHHKKSSGTGADPIDDILGSTGKAAVCDCAMGLYKEHGKGGATLKITGRDVEARDEALSWNGLKCEWEFEGGAYLARANSEKGRVLDAIQAVSGEGADPTVTAISKRTGIAASNVSDSIQTLVRDGRIYRGQKKGISQPYYPAKAVMA